MLGAFAGLSVRVIESGLQAAGAAMRTAQSAIGLVSGQPAAKPPAAPPASSPADLDGATSEFANRMTRLLRYWIVSGNGGWSGASRDVWSAARRSFSGIDLNDPRHWFELSLQLPLSLGTLFAQEAVRGLHALEIVGPENAAGFFVDLSEAYLDIPVYVMLQYPAVIERYRKRLEHSPDDADTRLQLGRSYTKCGLYSQAIEELTLAAQYDSVRARARYELVIANYRAGHFDQAAREGVAAMADGIDHERMQYWTWLSAQRLGGYPAETRPEHRIEMAAGRHPTRLRFEEVSAKIGLDKTSGGRGTAVFDYDGDGRLDVLISAVSGGMSLYHNNGDGTFTDVSVGSGLDSWVNTWGVSVGDYDNDGLPDVFVTRLGFLSGDPALFHNNGDGTFTNVTEQAGIKVWTPGFVSCWVDYNCDGLLDLFIPANLGGLFHRNRPNCLYRNNGDGTFTDVTESSGLGEASPTIGACWGDYDNDGFPDLFLSNPLGRPSLFHNNGDGTFTDVSRESGIDLPALGFVTSFCDYDDDGWLDIVQFVWCRYEDMIASLRHGRSPRGDGPLRIFHNNRDGTFTNVSRDLGIDESWGTMSGNAGDLNNDGLLDLILGNGGPQMDRTEPVVVLENQRGSFRNVTFSAGLPVDGKSHGANVADLFGDGRLHVISASGGMYPGDLMTTSVFRPVELPGNFLNVRLVGTRSNRDAIGARVKLTAGGRDQHRLVGGGSGFGCLPLEQHFGLAGLTEVEALEIWWPSGVKQRIAGLPFNDTVRITEGIQGWERVYAGKSDLGPLARLK